MLNVLKTDLKFGDVVLVAFPFADYSDYKYRPAIVTYNVKKMRELKVVMITSATIDYNELSRIVIEKDSEAYIEMGLKKGSVIRLEKEATLAYRLVKFNNKRCPDSLIREMKDRRQKMENG